MYLDILYLPPNFNCKWWSPSAVQNTIYVYYHNSSGSFKKLISPQPIRLLAIHYTYIDLTTNSRCMECNITQHDTRHHCGRIVALLEMWLDSLTLIWCEHYKVATLTTHIQCIHILCIHFHTYFFHIIIYLLFCTIIISKHKFVI